MRAYSKIYLNQAQDTLGFMIDCAINYLHIDLENFWNKFLQSDEVKAFEIGSPKIIAGKSGRELAFDILNIKPTKSVYKFAAFKGKEFWLGWALAYFQWESSYGFSQITSKIAISEILNMYSPYHEMDVRQFSDHMQEIYNQRKNMTNLKARRIEYGFTQLDLAEATDIPLRTIQQYEQGQKNINKASAENVLSLAQALKCKPSLLLE